MRSRSTSQTQSGVTLVELMVVIVIISVVATLALFLGGSANDKFKRQNVATQLKNAFERARFDSVKRRATGGEAAVTVTPTSYTLRTYLNGVEKDDVTTLPTGIVIANYDHTTLTSSVVSFNMRGEVPTTPSPQFYVCNASCNTVSDSTANVVLVTVTGTVNLLPGTSSTPSFGLPSQTPVPTSSGVNPDAVL